MLLAPHQLFKISIVLLTILYDKRGVLVHFLVVATLVAVAEVSGSGYFFFNNLL